MHLGQKLALYHLKRLLGDLDQLYVGQEGIEGLGGGGPWTNMDLSWII